MDGSFAGKKAQNRGDRFDGQAHHRLGYLDGLRGLAALYVVAHHAYMEIGWRGDSGRLSGWLAGATHWLYYGHIGVDVFLVLSGYCLMLPVVTSGGGRLRGGLGGFLKRRAWRILPPYYAALGCTLLLIALVPEMNQPSGVRWDVALPAFSTNVLGSHLLLIHNLSPQWVFKIDYPMWSIATEWQVYFFFPLLLVLWRKFGITAAIIVAFAAGFAPHFLLPPKWNLDHACPWLLGLFGLGVLGAVVSCPRFAGRYWRKRCPWGAWAAILAGVLGLATQYHIQWLWGHRYLWESVVGLATVCLILFCNKNVAEIPSTHRPLVLRFLESSWVTKLGSFSYSLYLVHAPLLALLHLAIRPLGLPAKVTLGILIGVGVPEALAIAYLFHRIFEFPFLSSYPLAGRDATKASSA